MTLADDAPSQPEPVPPIPAQPSPAPSEPQEQRHDPRVAHPFMVRYQCQESWHVSPLKDFSTTGARFVADYPFTQGEVLDAQMIFPLARQPIAVRARIVWMKPTQWGLVELGVTFELGDAEAKQAIEAAVAHFLRKQERRK